MGLLVMSPLCFKARVGSLIHTCQRHTSYICSLRFTSGATPLPMYIVYILYLEFQMIHVSDRVMMLTITKDDTVGKDTKSTTPYKQL